MELREHLLRLIEENLPSQDHFLVDLVIKGTDQQRKVIILLDGDHGVTIDNCASLSRAIANSLEENDPFPGQYNLEVSSAGIDHPISLKRQYLSRVGKTLTLNLSGGDELSGILMEVSGDEIVVNKETKVKNKKITETVNVPLAEIEKAMVQVTFKK